LIESGNDNQRRHRHQCKSDHIAPATVIGERDINRCRIDDQNQGNEHGSKNGLSWQTARPFEKLAASKKRPAQFPDNAAIKAGFAAARKRTEDHSNNLFLVRTAGQRWSLPGGCIRRYK
jgi:hypothetical protein